MNICLVELTARITSLSSMSFIASDTASPTLIPLLRNPSTKAFSCGFSFMLEYSYVYIVLTVRSTPTVRIHIPWLAHKLPEPFSSLPNHVAYPRHPGAADSFPETPGSSLFLLSERLQRSGMGILGVHSHDLKMSGRRWQPGDRRVLCGISGKEGDTDY